eukprot:1117384-Pleurochrysis_carterae.AAC.1
MELTRASIVASGAPLPSGITQHCRLSTFSTALRGRRSRTLRPIRDARWREFAQHEHLTLRVPRVRGQAAPRVLQGADGFTGLGWHQLGSR